MLPAGPRRQTGSPIPDRSGRVHPNPDFQQRYAFTVRRLYGVSLDWLYLGDEYQNAEPFRRKLEAARERRREPLLGLLSAPLARGGPEQPPVRPVARNQAWDRGVGWRPNSPFGHAWKIPVPWPRLRCRAFFLAGYGG